LFLCTGIISLLAPVAIPLIVVHPLAAFGCLGRAIER
jgi:hypothetical protein